MTSKPIRILISIVSLALLLGIWETLARVGLLFTAFSMPSAILVKGYQLVVSGQLQSNLVVSLYELVVAFVLVVIIAIPIGLVMGSSRIVEHVLDPYVTSLLSTPKIVLWPLVLFIFGIASPSKIILAFLFGVFPLIVNALNGAKSVDRVLKEVAISFGTARGQLFRKVILPGSMAKILPGLKTSYLFCTLGVVTGEVFGSILGLGRLVADAGDLYDFQTIFVVAMVVIAIGLIGSNAIDWATSKFMPWTKT